MQKSVLKGLENPDHYNQVFDILDVWFDSGSTHAFVLRDRDDGSDDGFADLYLEGSQHRVGSIHRCFSHAGQRDGRHHGVLTHGFTLDEKA